MQKLDTDNSRGQSADLVASNIERLRALFPELICEGPAGLAVDVEALKVLVGDSSVAAGDEKYGLNWHGKRRAAQLALTPSSGTLRPRPAESVDWSSTANLLVEGDNLEALKLLRKSFAGKVKLIYIDPPYNTGNDFVYPDTFQDSIRHYQEITGQREGGVKTSSNVEASGRFHTDWLNMIYPRLKLAHSLLKDDGLLVVHIDEHEVHSLVLLLRELFGEENELGAAVWDKRNPKGDARGIAYQHESLVIFAKNAELLFERAPLKRAKRNAQRMLDAAKQAMASTTSMAEASERYRAWVKTQTGLSGGEAMYDRISTDGRVYRLVSMAWPNKKKAPDDYFLPLIHPVSGLPCPVPERGWRNPPATMHSLLQDGRIQFGVDERSQPQRVYFLDENMVENVPSILPYAGSDDALLKELGVPFDQPKPLEFLASVLSWCSSGDDIVLDFFAGSGSTGHAVMALNARDGGQRRFILVQLPEPLGDSKEQIAAATFCRQLGKPANIAEITKERLRRAAAKVRAEHADQPVDTGFRVFGLDSSNLREWNVAPDDLVADLFAAVEHIKADRSQADLLHEVMLKLGLDPCSAEQTRQVGGRTLHLVGDGALIACLEQGIDEQEVDTLAGGIVALHGELASAAEVTCLFRDDGFAGDVAKLNLCAILQQHGIHRVRSI